MGHEGSIAWCAAALLIGTVLGYVLNWAVRRVPKPDAVEIGALVGAVVGGGVWGRLRELVGCPAAVAWYLIGVAVGFFLYLVALRRRWDQIAALMSQGKLTGMPIFPWTITRP